MTRKSTREIERRIEQLTEQSGIEGEFADTPQLTPEQKQELADLFDVDHREENPEVRKAMDEAHKRFNRQGGR